MILRNALTALLLLQAPAFAGAGESRGIATRCSFTQLSDRTYDFVQEPQLQPGGPLFGQDPQLTPGGPVFTGEKIGPGVVIVAVGAGAWKLINAGQPQAHLDHYYASAYPGWASWTQISGWEGRREVRYGIACENRAGMTVLDMSYAVSFNYGGKTPDGKGAYIGNLTVKTEKFDIQWATKFSLGIRISNPSNAGTDEAPMAYLQTDAFWTFSSPLVQKVDGFQTYGVYGDGRFMDLSADNPDFDKELAPPQDTETPAVPWN
ncbi:MAG: hypothetical protein FD189_1151 [Elusimicrobia bacterium]|nr:MAG: hypothetical protein FD154_858 [Elusimicrobiota bacterium]KAF0156107.1 MAG: hypothetical protein FD189_1151 [Elusimicrobiota bacterium]